MPLARLPEPFDHPDWIFELKYDGFRALAHLENGAIEAKTAVLDGEIVYLGKDGRPEFYSLMRRRSPQHFYAFDLLWLDGRDLRQLMERKRMLSSGSAECWRAFIYLEL